MHLKVSSAKCQQFSLGLNVLNCLCKFPTQSQNTFQEIACQKKLFSDVEFERCVFRTIYKGHISHYMTSFTGKTYNSNYGYTQALHQRQKHLTHWGLVTHICVGNLTIIDLAPGRRQAIIWIKSAIVTIGLLETNFS